MSSDDELFTPEELSEKVGRRISRSTIYARCQDGTIPHYRIGASKRSRGKYLIKWADWVAWLESNRHDADQPVPDGELKYL